MNTSQAVTAYLKERQTVGAVSQPTVQHMRGLLSHFAGCMPDDPANIRRRDILRWQRTTCHLSAGTKRLYYVRAKGFTDWLLRRGITRRDPFLDIPPPKVPKSVHRALDDDQARKLLGACVNEREKMIVVLGLHVGLRRAEMADLEVGDVSLASKTVLVRCGKGGHQRLLPLSEDAAAFVSRYVGAAGLTSGPMLRSEQDPEAGVRPGTVSRVFAEVAFRSGVKVRAGDHIAPHALRHTAATGWYQSTGDILAVRDLLGHAHLSSTERYVRGMSVERLRPAVNSQHYLDAA